MFAKISAHHERHNEGEVMPWSYCAQSKLEEAAEPTSMEISEFITTIIVDIVMRPQETQPNQPEIHHSRHLSAVPRAVSMVQVPSTQSMRRPTPVATPSRTTKARAPNRSKSLPAATQASPRKNTRTQKLSAASAKRVAITKRKASAASTVPSVRSKTTAQRPAATPRNPTPAAATMLTRSSARRALAPPEPEVVTPRKRKVFDAVVIDVGEGEVSAPSARAKRQRVQPPPTAPCSLRKKVFDGVEIPFTRWMTTRVAPEITVLRRASAQYPLRPPRPSQKKIFDGVEVDYLRRCYANRQQIGTSWGNLGEDVYSDHVSTPGAELETDSQSVHSDDLVDMGSVDPA